MPNKSHLTVMGCWWCDSIHCPECEKRFTGYDKETELYSCQNCGMQFGRLCYNVK